MRHRTLTIAVAAGIILGGVASGAIAVSSASDDDAPISEADRTRVSAAALTQTGGGSVIEIDRDAEDGGAWEVEVARPDGQVVDVRVDASFNAVSAEDDSEAQDATEPPEVTSEDSTDEADDEADEVHANNDDDDDDSSHHEHADDPADTEDND